ncbi:MAG: PEP-CTERM sorting domain-containing protein [Planctomycetota bacterium]
MSVPLRKLLYLCILACFAVAAGKNARAIEIVDITFQADDSGRFIERFSNGFAEIGRTPNGMYAIDNPNGPLLGTPVTVFPSGGDWANAGTITLDGIATRSGSETLNILGAEFDFNTFVSGSSASVLAQTPPGGPPGLAGNYTTSITSAMGTVSLFDGLVTSISFDADVAFIFPFFEAFPYNSDGTAGNEGLSIASNGDFVLAVDDEEDAFGVPNFGPSQAWAFTGTASGVLRAAAVPEPGTTIGLLALFTTVICSRKRNTQDLPAS